MPSLKVIRKRIASTKATQKITRAMKMVAGARLTRAQQRIVAHAPLRREDRRGARSRSRATMVARPRRRRRDEALHPLLARRAGEEASLFVVLSGDRGLCGAFNTNINKAAERDVAREGGRGRRASRFATLGRKGREYLDAPRRRRSSQRLPARLRRARPRRRRAWSRAWLVPRFEQGRGRRGLPRLQRVQERDHAEGRRSSALLPLAADAATRRGRGDERLAPTRVPLRAEPARAARAPRADVRRDHASTARSSRARRASSARR